MSRAELPRVPATMPKSTSPERSRRELTTVRTSLSDSATWLCPRSSHALRGPLREVVQEPATPTARECAGRQVNAGRLFVGSNVLVEVEQVGRVVLPLDCGQTLVCRGSICLEYSRLTFVFERIHVGSRHVRLEDTP